MLRTPFSIKSLQSQVVWRPQYHILYFAHKQPITNTLFNLRLVLSDFAPPAPVRCRDDPDLKDCCKKLKGKGFCSSQVEFMEIVCAETCNYCPKGVHKFFCKFICIFALAKIEKLEFFKTNLM